MSSQITLFIYCAVIAAVSFAFSRLPGKIKISHRQMQLLLSFVSGLILGIAMLHLLPEVIASELPGEKISYAILTGLVGMFFLERCFSYHQHEIDEETSCSHNAIKDVSISGVLTGLTFHSLLAGAALSSSMLWEHTSHGHEHLHSHGAGMSGFGVFLAILFHKPLEALSLGVLVGQKFEKGKVLAILVFFALTIPIGAVFGQVLFSGLGLDGQALVLAVAVGMFLCVALSDLLPELHFHSHDKGMLSVCLLAGLFLSYLSLHFGH